MTDIIIKKTLPFVGIGGKLLRSRNIQITPVNFGLLYNGYVGLDSRNVCSEGWHMPSNSEFSTLASYLGGASIAGGKLKEIGNTYWNATNVGATNEAKFNARGAGYRNSSFFALKVHVGIWTISEYTGNLFYAAIENNSAYLFLGSTTPKNNGNVIRPIKDSTTLTHGQSGFYTDPSGYTYPTICIGTQEWVAMNVITKHYRDGTPIPEVTGNSDFAARTTGALCAFNNDWNNV